MKELYMKKRAVSPTLATIILIVICIVVSIMTYAWIQVIAYVDVEVNIRKKIYAPEQNIGILNEIGNFNISLKNIKNNTKIINIIITNKEGIIYKEAVTLKPESSEYLSITIKLLELSLWTIKVLDENEKIIDGYSFQTVLNIDEADIMIIQKEDMESNRIRSNIAIIISILSLITSIGPFISKRKTYKKLKTFVRRKMAVL